MKGIVQKEKIAKGMSEPYGFDITGEYGKTYFAHLGDIKNNEYLVYNNIDKITRLMEGDAVDFQPDSNISSNGIKHAINVRKENFFGIASYDAIVFSNFFV